MTVCPHCKKQFVAKTMEIELIEGMEDGNARIGKVAYSCPACHTFLGVGEAVGASVGSVFGMGIQQAMQDTMHE
jgi:uncharacterized protein YbaR (Trm112 family)